MTGGVKVKRGQLPARRLDKRPVVGFDIVGEEALVVAVPEANIDVFYSDLGRRLRDARTRAGLTQAQLAARASMTRSSVANIEAGRQRIQIHVLVSVAAELAVNPGSLFSSTLLPSSFAESQELIVELSPNDEPTDRDFVEGAVAQLGMTVRKEAVDD